MNTNEQGPHDPCRPGAEHQLGQAHLPVSRSTNLERHRHDRHAQLSRSRPSLPFLRRQVIAADRLPTQRPPEGWAILYELAASHDMLPVYVGQTGRDLASRISCHISLARHRADNNRRLEAWIRGLAKEGQTLIIRVVGLHPAGEGAARAECALIAEHRARYGTALLNQSGG